MGSGTTLYVEFAVSPGVTRFEIESWTPGSMKFKDTQEQFTIFAATDSS